MTLPPLSLAQLSLKQRALLEIERTNDEDALRAVVELLTKSPAPAEGEDPDDPIIGYGIDGSPHRKKATLARWREDLERARQEGTLRTIEEVIEESEREGWQGGEIHHSSGRVGVL